jgi:hypothetical protein
MASGWATIIENLGFHGHNNNPSNGERFACNPTKGFLQTYEGNQSSLLKGGAFK